LKLHQLYYTVTSCAVDYWINLCSLMHEIHDSYKESRCLRYDTQCHININNIDTSCGCEF